MKVFRTTLLLAVLVSVEPSEGRAQQWAGDIQTYAQHCAEVIGEPVPDFDCLADGVEIPIFDHDAPPTGAFNPPKCDRPATMNSSEVDPCQVGSRFGVLRGSNPDISSTFICRRENSEDGYDEVAVIQHNASNGATCWFRGTLAITANNAEIAMPERKLGNAIASPIRSAFVNDHPDPETPRITWHTVNRFFCRSCHDIDPFIRSPYIQEAATRNAIEFPSVYRPDQPVTDFRFWNPLFPDSDSELSADLIVFEPGSDGARCTTCHVIARNSGSELGGVARYQLLLLDSLGQKSSSDNILTNGGSPTKQEAHATHPDHAWMHVDRPPFEMAKPSAATLRAYADIKARTAAEVPGLCRYVKPKGRPPIGVEIMGLTPAEGATISAGASIGVQARLLNHDFGDQVAWVVRKPSGITFIPRKTAHEDAMALQPQCKPGEQVTLSAQVVKADGTAGGASATRRFRCVESRLEFFDAEGRTVAALSDPVRTGGIVGVRALGLALSDLLLGDQNLDLHYRSFLSFPLTAPAGIAPRKADLVFSLRTDQGQVAANFGDARVLHVDLEDALDRRDFARDGLLQEGVSRFDPAPGVKVIDVTRHVAVALAQGRARVDLGIWLTEATDGDQRIDTLRIVNQPRTAASGDIDFTTLLQPVLRLTY